MLLRTPAVNCAPAGTISLPRKSNKPLDFLPAVRTINLSTNTSSNAACFSSYSSSNFGRTALALLVFFFFAARENKLVPITTPFNDGEAFNDASLTSPALSPKIARRSFSSGVGSDSPLGVILPIMISPGTT